MCFETLLAICNHLGIYCYRRGEPKILFYLRLFQKIFIPIVLILVFVALLLNGDKWIRVFTLIGYGICALLLILLKVKLKKRYTPRPPGCLPTFVLENELRPFIMRQQERALRRTLMDPSIGPRDKCLLTVRYWLSIEVFKPLLVIIEQTNVKLLRAAFTSKKIGGISLHRLESFQNVTSFIELFCPRYYFLLAFLRIYQDQEYLVKRFYEFAQGSFLLNYCPFPPPVQEIALMTDSAIIFHSFCVFMDDFMRRDSNYPSDSRPFFEGVVRVGSWSPDCATFKYGIAIFCSEWVDPKYRIVRYQRGDLIITDEVGDPFETIADFLFILKYGFQDFLGSTNFGYITCQIFGEE